MRLRYLVAVAWLLMISLAGRAGEIIVDSARTADGKIVPYVLTQAGEAPKYVVILFPGGAGIVNPRLENGVVAYEMRTNFLMRSREHLVDADFASVAMDTTAVKPRIQAVIDDLKARFPAAGIYLMGTSRGTYDTMGLAEYLQDKIDGEIHTSSMSEIGFFDTRALKNRHLIVHHKLDTCRTTPFTAAQWSHEKYGTEFLAMSGGFSNDDACKPFAYHGFHGIERETIVAIKEWIKRGR